MATEEQIRNYAHLLWEKAGRPNGRAEEFWHAAEVELNAESESPDAPTEETLTDETNTATANDDRGLVVPCSRSAESADQCRLGRLWSPTRGNDASN
jgi:DUF2934 family protein